MGHYLEKANGLKNGDPINGQGLAEDPVREASAPIAVIGMSCKFPGDATSPEKLWQLCADGRSAWSEIPASRFNQRAFYHPHRENSGTTHVRGGHFMKEDISLFDASFFNFTTEVASSMDPQFRLQLESTFEALESAGIPLLKIAGTNTSVYGGCFFRDHNDSLMRDPDLIPRYTMLGNGAAMISNRISHFFDLGGPSMTVDTGCSTSLTALHLACQSIRAEESTISIVGGASLMLNPDMFISLSSLGSETTRDIWVLITNRNVSLLGADGKSYPFDSRASGYGRGEGVATVVLKSLEDAIKDGDPIRAVIRETSLNHDGKTPTVTSPSKIAQEGLIRKCYQSAGLNPLNTTYVEAHGTGTQAGDPVETEAIGIVFGQGRPADKPLYIGSVKSNIGHLESSSGLAAIIKVALAFEKGFIPPSINYENPNPGIYLDQWKLKIPRRLEPWPSGQLRRASISNFGYGGANAHVIIEDPTYYQSHSQQSAKIRLSNGVKPHTIEKWKLFSLSAKDSGAAQAMKLNLRDYLGQAQKKEKIVNLEDLAYTLGQRRSVFPWTVAVTAQNIPDLIEALDDSHLKPIYSAEVPRIGFIFTGQGAQWHAMGRELIEAYPVFKQSLREADQYLRDLGASWSLIDELKRDEMTSRVNEPALSLPLCAAVQISLVNLLRSWNITPTAAIGHSSGEVGAAFAAGAIDFRDALTIVYVRGVLTSKFLQRSRTRGGMLAIGLGREAAVPYLSGLTSGKAVIACVNSPSSVTVSGDLEAIEEIEANIHSANIFARKLKVEAAYHSHQMQPLAKEYLTALQRQLGHNGNLSETRFSSSVTGDILKSAEQLDAAYWVQNMLQPVLFEDSLRNICVGSFSPNSENSEKLVDTLIEIGPHGALAGPIRQTLLLSEAKTLNISYETCLRRGENAVKTLQILASFLLSKGYPVDLSAVNFPLSLKTQTLRVVHDLPSYPWNHSVGHWMEPRLNRDYRHRKSPPHDLLGSAIVGNNPGAPTWRHFIRPSEIPWVREHTVQSEIVYPGAGFISMAIEAIRQVHQFTKRSIAGYHLRDIEIMKALVIPDTPDGVETQISLSESSDKSLDMGSWQKFHVCSTSGSDSIWTEHCKGFISVEYKTSIGDDAPDWSPVPAKLASEKKFDLGFPAHTRSIDPTDLFKNLRSLGINHGPSFQNLIFLQSGQNCSLATFKISNTASLMPFNHQLEHLLHPITLDAPFQAAFAALPGGGTTQTNASIPRSIKSMFVSHDISSDPGHRFQSFATLHHHDSQGFEVSVAAVDEGDIDLVPILKIEGLHLQSVGAMVAQGKTSEDLKICSTMHWECDISLMQPEDLKKLLSFPPDSAEGIIMEDLKRVTFYFIDETLASLTDEDVQTLEWHHRSFYNWMKLQHKRAITGEMSPNSSTWIKSSEGVRRLLIDNVSLKSLNGEMACRIGQNLTSILRKEIAPLELMLEDKLLYTYYAEGLKYDRLFLQVEKLVSLFAHKFQRANILEIGGGTGGCTRHVLKALGGGDSVISSRFTRYDFTDISSGFFEAAQAKFAAWGDLITYQKLDIEKNPGEQSFELNSYDLIIACQVLHATKNMGNTMTNVSKLLKPGGRLIMVESTNVALDVQLVFGTLPGWWLSEEDERKLNPNLTLDSWKKVLKRSGFNDVDVDVRDCEDEEIYTTRTIMATATTEVSVSSHPRIAIINVGLKTSQLWLENLKDSIALLTSTIPTLESLGQVHSEGKVCIVLDDIDQPILSRLTADEFGALKRLLKNANEVLWVSRGGAINCERPDDSLHTGLLRTLRAEDTSKTYISLDLDPNQDPWTATAKDAILKVFQATFNNTRNKSLIEYEYAERDSLVLVPRVHSDLTENDSLSVRSTTQIPELQSFYQPGRALKMHAETPGLLDSLVFSDDPSASKPLPDDFVQIDPKAFGLNFRDIMVAMGQLRPKVMGMESSGIITRTGPKASHVFKVGDRVCALTTKGHWANRIRIHWKAVAHIPDEMTFEVAASIPLAFTTAYYSLHDIAGLQKGETVLIHSAAGAVGQAAIQIAKVIDAEIFVTVGSKEKRDFIAKMYDINPDHIYSSRDPSFATNVMAITQGKGVDVVLNFLAGHLLQESWKCVASLGRFVEIGKRDIQLNKNLGMDHFDQGTSFSAVDIIHLGQYKIETLSRVLADVLRLMAEKFLKPVAPITVFSISEIVRAFRVMQAGKHLGKIVIKPNPSSLVNVLPQTLSAKLSPNCSYLITGGLGGIGQRIAQWMVQQGARNLILLSRHAAAQTNTQVFLKELRETGCQVVAKNCDIAYRSILTKVADDCVREMPPVRGIIHAAMVLQDSLFEHMPLEAWQTAIRPKVQGTWNLHKTFHDLDFFVMLSSATGVLGNSSQANYAAGGTFQDAFARFRSSNGLPAVSIDLGLVKSIGYAAETKGVTERLVRMGYRPIEVDEVLAVIESAIKTPIRLQSSSQIITGIPSFDRIDGNYWRQDLRFSDLRKNQNASQTSREHKGNQEEKNIQHSLTDALTWADAVNVVTEAIIKKLSNMFTIPEAQIDKTMPMTKYNVDSLVAVELRNWLASRSRAEISIFDVMQSTSLMMLGEKVAAKSKYVAEAGLCPPL